MFYLCCTITGASYTVVIVPKDCPVYEIKLINGMQELCELRTVRSMTTDAAKAAST